MDHSDSVARLNAALEGRYRIQRPLGEGGMATVYLADDLKHNRKVALKVLKPELAAVVGAERFLAEIETTANLTHPHILPLHDSGEADRFLYYVMPYVDGESLRDKLDRERQLSVDEAVRIARDLAEALDYAHRHEVIHRDIKPANIMIQDGRPMIADFGIALAVGSAGGARLTETGLSLGTPYYMSPEQATGDSQVGPATDIYALGCVLFEMLVGEPPYPGTTAQAVLGKIIAGGPVSAAEQRRSVPVHVDAAIARALEKLPADRFTSAADFARALSDPSFRHGLAGTGAAAAADVSSWKRRTLGATVLAVIAVIWAATANLWEEAPAESPVLRYSVPVDPAGAYHLGRPGVTRFGRPDANAFDISPDGRMLLYGSWTRDEGTGDLEGRLQLRRLDQPGATTIASGAGVALPSFSPDGDWVMGLEGPVGPLVRISVASGEKETLVQRLPARYSGAHWADSGEIFLTDVERRLWRVPQAGGEPRAVEIRPAPGDTVAVAHPLALPGGRIVLFSVLDFREEYSGEIRAVDVETGDSWTVAEDAMDAGYLESGHLLFMRDGALLAAKMDPETARLTGSPVTILADVMHAVRMPNSASDTGVGLYAASRTGHLAYLPGGIFPPGEGALIKVASDGSVDTLDAPVRDYRRVRISPDGSRVALTARDSEDKGDIYLYDVQRGVTTRLGIRDLQGNIAIWSPDGEHLAFMATRQDSLFRIRADGTAPREPLAFDPGGTDGVYAWHPDGDMVFADGGNYYRGTPSDDVVPLVESPSALAYGTLSPDGRWFAYASTESGSWAVYLRPYPGPGAAIRVSPGDFGLAPAWSADGRTLFYRSTLDGVPAIYAVAVTPGERLGLGTPRVAFPDWTHRAAIPHRSYDPAPDGTMYALTFEGDLRDRYAVDDIHLFLGFSQEVTRRLRELDGQGR